MPEVELESSIGSLGRTSKTAINVATVMNNKSKTKYFPGHCLQEGKRSVIFT